MSKWDPGLHSSTVGLILNHSTGYLMPQFHCIYDNLYTPVPNGFTITSFDTTEFDFEIWEQINANGGHEQVDYRDNKGIGELGPDWLSEEEQQALQQPRTI
jgi:hypothetical protein